MSAQREAHEHGNGLENESELTVLLAFAANLGIAIAIAAALLTGSASMAAEADPLVGYLVLGVSLVLEAISWQQAFRQVRDAARAEGCRCSPTSAAPTSPPRSAS